MLIEKSRNRKVLKFLEMVSSDLKDYEFKLKIYKRKSNHYMGYFDEANRELVIFNDEDQLATLVHEYSHFIQWKNNSNETRNYYRGGFDPDLVVQRWVNRKIKYNNKVKVSFNRIRRNEMECEKIGISLIKKYQLPIKIKDYKQSANRQLVMYHFVESTRSWKIRDVLLKAPSITEIIPTTLQDSYVKRIPKKLMKATMEYFDYE